MLTVVHASLMVSEILARRNLWWGNDKGMLQKSLHVCICWQKHIICTISVSRSHCCNKFNKLTHNQDESLQSECNNCEWFSVPLDDNTYVSDTVSLGFRSCGMTFSVTGWLVADVLKEMLSQWHSSSASCCFGCIIVGGIQCNWGIITLNGNQRITATWDLYDTAKSHWSDRRHSTKIQNIHV